MGFEKSLILDVLLTGLSILLEFWALVALRIREPELARPFRVPGGIAGAVAIGVPPLALMIAAVARNRTELVGSTNELVIGIGIVAAGAGLYFLSKLIPRKRSAAVNGSEPETLSLSGLLVALHACANKLAARPACERKHDHDVAIRVEIRDWAARANPWRREPARSLRRAGNNPSH